MVGLLQIDQAEGLRRLMTQDTARILSFYGATERLGHSQITIHLAQALAEFHDRRLLILDQCEEKSQLVNLLNLDLKHNNLFYPELLHVLMQEIDFKDILIQIPNQDIYILPCEKGVRVLKKLDQHLKNFLVQSFKQLPMSIDTVFIHADEHNLESDNQSFSLLTQENIIIITADYESIQELYSTIRKIFAHIEYYTQYQHKKSYKRFHILINKVSDESQALELFQRISKVAQQYLDIDLDYLGFVPFDDKLLEASESKQLLDLKENTPATIALKSIAEKIIEFPYSGENSKLDILIQKTLSIYQQKS